MQLKGQQSQGAMLTHPLTHEGKLPEGCDRDDDGDAPLHHVHDDAPLHYVHDDAVMMVLFMPKDKYRHSIDN